MFMAFRATFCHEGIDLSFTQTINIKTSNQIYSRVMALGVTFQILLIILISLIYRLYQEEEVSLYEKTRQDYLVDKLSEQNRNNNQVIKIPPVCEEELKKLGENNYLLIENINLRLKRTCPLDDEKISRFLFITSLQFRDEKSFNELKRIKVTARDPNDCLEVCFSHGHSYATFKHKKKTGNIACRCIHDPSRVNEIAGSLTQIRNSNSQHDRDAWQLFKVDNGIYSGYIEPEIGNLQFKQNTSDPDIKIAFLLSISGRAFSQVILLLKNIYSSKHFYFIHVDARDIYLYNSVIYLKKILQKSHIDNIIISTKRRRTIWGGTSLLTMILETISNEKLQALQWDFLINISESDLPVRSIEDLEHYLVSKKGLIFLRFHQLSGSEFIKKQGLDINFYQCKDRVWKLKRRKLPRGVRFGVGGSDWFALPRDFCNFIAIHYVDYLKNSGINSILRYQDSSNKESKQLDTDDKKSKELVQSLIEFYNFTLLSTESFFHTLATNSEFCNKIVNFNLRLTNWPLSSTGSQACTCQHKNVVDWCGCSPRVYRSSSWIKLESIMRLPRPNSVTTSNHQDSLTKNNTRLLHLYQSVFFTRKFDPTISSSIVDKVDSLLQQISIFSETSTDGKIIVKNFDAHVINILGKMSLKRYNADNKTNSSYYWHNEFDFRRDTNLRWQLDMESHFKYNKFNHKLKSQAKSGSVLASQVIFARYVIKQILNNSMISIKLNDDKISSDGQLLKYHKNPNENGDRFYETHLLKHNSYYQSNFIYLINDGIAEFELTSIDVLFINDCQNATILTFRCISCENNTADTEDRVQVTSKCNSFQILVLDRTKHINAIKNSFRSDHDTIVHLDYLEVNEGYDVNERLFKSLRWLNQVSMLSAYSKWSFGSSYMNTFIISSICNSSNVYMIKFIIINPNNQIEATHEFDIISLYCNQNNTAKMSNDNNKFDFHFFFDKLSSPMMCGTWKVKVETDDKQGRCLHEHKFLVFPNNPFVTNNINQTMFDEFYHVTNICKQVLKDEQPDLLNGEKIFKAGSDVTKSIASGQDKRGNISSHLLSKFNVIIQTEDSCDETSWSVKNEFLK